MASTPEPFLRYLTVFRSRLGLANLVLSVTTLGHQPDQALRRRVRQVLERRVELDLAVPENDPILQYLLDKKVVSAGARSTGRYRGIQLSNTDGRWRAYANGTAQSVISVFQTDVWLSNPLVPSTIGAPTPDNLEEVVELAVQLRLISRSRNSWTASGELLSALRASTKDRTPVPDNPFVLGAESAGLLRCLLEEDGPVIRQLLGFLSHRDSVRRDDVADALPGIVEAALIADWSPRLPSQSLALGRELVAKLRGAEGGGPGPGVREHRSSPRLEWLTDLGYLSKEGLRRNGFEYRVTPLVSPLLEAMERVGAMEGEWATAVSLEAWRSNPHWRPLRESLAIDDPRTAFAAAYRMLRRPIGPASLRNVAFMYGLLCARVPSMTALEDTSDLIRTIPGASLSGGRFGRAPESVYLSEESLGSLGPG